MKNKIEVTKNLLDTLTDEELLLLINIPPKEILIEPIKKHSKDFKEETKGFRMEVRSLGKKLPDIYFNRIRKGDVNLTRVLIGYANYIVNSINDILVNENSNDNFFEEMAASEDNLKFCSLVETILIGLKSENLKLYFKLRGHILSVAQNELIDKELPIIIARQEIKEQLAKELKVVQDNKIIEIENNYSAIITTLKNDISRLRQQCTQKEQDILVLTNQIATNNTLALDHHSKLESIILALEEKIEDLSFQIIEKQKFLEEQTKNNETLIELLNDKYNTFNKLAYEEWKETNIKLLQENEFLENNCEELKGEAASIENEITTLENSVSSWKNQINSYLDNIDKEIIRCTLDRSLLGCGTSAQKDIDNIQRAILPYTKESVRGNFIDMCATIQEFAENIADNLDAIGAAKQADTLANYLVGVIASGLVPLVCGYNPREIATAVSVAYCGESPYIISLPNGYINSRELVDLYSHAKANVVLIEDSIGTMNENSLLPLLREIMQTRSSQKLLILAVENIGSVKYMPESLYNYIGLVSVKGLFTAKQAKYIYSDAKNCVNDFIGNAGFNSELIKMKKLLKATGLSNPYSMLRARIVNYIKKISNLEEALNSYCAYELGLMCEFRDMKEQIEKNISLYSMDFKATLFDTIKGDTDE